MHPNNIYLLKAFCIPIESENARCHPDLGDGRMSYINNGYKVFQHGEQWYFMPEANDHGNDRTMTNAKLRSLYEIFGIENVLTIEELPKEEETN
jgi:hypothetical protein